MLVVLVQVHVKAESVDAFRDATLENARASLGEPGVARFDVIQEQADSTRFLLIEVYKSTAAAAEHKDTVHYQNWRDRVAEMMAEPRTSKKYDALFPGDAGWLTARD